MPDTLEQATIATPTDNTQTAAALVSDAYKPGDDNKSLNTDLTKKDTSTADSLFGVLHIFDSSSSDSKAAAPAPADADTTDSTAPAAATASSASDSSANPPSFIDRLKSAISGGAANDQITRVTGTDKDGNSEVLGVGPIKVSTPDPFDWRHPIDSAGKFIEHPIDTTEQKIQHDAENLKDLYDRVTGNDKPADPKDTKDPNDSPEKQHLVELESKITDPAKKAQFEKDMADFEQRAKEGNPPLKPEQVAETYKEIGRLMDSQKSGLNLSDADRQTIAEQIINHAAHPDRIDQGNHDTCAAASLESQIFTKDPAKAAKLIVDVSIDGSYHDKDQTAISVDGSNVTKKDAHTMDYPPKDNERTMASQIFQTTAVRMIYNDYRQDTPEAGRPNDTGERIGTNNDFPGLTNDQVGEISRRITGTDNGDTIIANARDKTDETTSGVFIDSPKALDDKLKELKEAHKLPAIINVDSRNEPFFSDSKGNIGGGSGGPHDVTIKDYIPGTPPKVVLENQWGKESEHTMTIDELYRATLPPGDPETIKELKAQVGPNLNDASVDPSLKLELLRQEHMAVNAEDRIDDKTYEMQMAQVMTVAELGWQKQRADGTFDENQARQAWTKFNEMALSGGDGQHLPEVGKGAITYLAMYEVQARKQNPELFKQMTGDEDKYLKELTAKLLANADSPTTPG